MAHQHFKFMFSNTKNYLGEKMSFKNKIEYWPKNLDILIPQVPQRDDEILFSAFPRNFLCHKKEKNIMNKTKSAIFFYDLHRATWV